MKRILKKILIVSGWLLWIAFLAVTLAFSARETEEVKCREIAIRYAGNQTIRLSKNELERMVRSADPHIIGRKMTEINSGAIESKLSSHKAILKADLYKTIVRDSTGYRGVITLKVKHRIPALRVLSAQENYYMDKEGNRIPASVSYAADVPIATGNISAAMAEKELLPLVEFIQNNRFWRAQIKQIHINEAGEILMTTLVGDQVIELGNTENMEEKFRNLRAFYDQVLTPYNWNKYNRVILKYNNQVIAKKNR